jgi:hypothetical protein
VSKQINRNLVMGIPHMNPQPKRAAVPSLLAREMQNKDARFYGQGSQRALIQAAHQPVVLESTATPGARASDGYRPLWVQKATLRSVTATSA